MRYFQLFVILTAISITCLGVVPVYAGGVMVSPAKIETVVHRGRALPPIRVSNRGENPVRVHVYVGWGGHDLDGMPVYQEAQGDRVEAQGWLAVRPTGFVVPAGQDREVYALPTPPAEFEGGFYPVVFFEVRSLASDDRSITRIAVLTLLTTAATDLPGTTLKSFDLGQDRRGRPLRVTGWVENKGLIHTRALLRVAFKDESGKDLGGMDLGPVVVLPGYQRRLTGTWGPERLPVGAYTAEVRLRNGAKADTAIQTAYFSVIEPYRVDPASVHIGSVELATVR